MLVEGKSEHADARKFADVFRQTSGFHFRASCGTRLWQEGYYDHVLRDEDATIDVARYIVLNPVRAGFCTDASSYPLLGSSRYTLAELLTAADWYPTECSAKAFALRDLAEAFALRDLAMELPLLTCPGRWAAGLRLPPAGLR